MKKKNKQWLSLALSAAMVVSTVPAVAAGTTVHAAANEAEVSIKNGEVTIGNEYLERKFTTTGDKLATAELDNKRANLKFTPAQGSEEFIIKLRQDGETKMDGELDRSNWTVTASDQYNNEVGAKDGPGANVIDGDASTIWHSKYSPDQPYPHSLTFDMKSEQDIAAFSYQPRQDSSTNGDIKGYKLYVGNDTATLESAENLAAEGNFTYNDRETIYVNLTTPKKGRYVKLVATSPKTDGQAWATAAEVKMYSKAVQTEDTTAMIKSSDLKLDTAHVEETDTENGVMVSFPFETVQKGGVDWDVTMKVTMDDGDHFMRKFLEIEVSDEQKAAIDYIDLESLNVNDSDATWTHPTMGSGVGGMSGYVISLGQPVYIQGMFLGCEFPMTETEIDTNKNAHMRYFSGKTFAKLQEDNQLTTDGKYVTWQTVAGAARSTDMNVIQSDFYEYINSIATRSDFRTQYNSWYDNMMTINDANIESAFTKMEKGLSESGVEPMDSYVVDDGWNNYNNQNTTSKVHDEARCGTTDNVTGFWEFNNKFPNGFRPASDLAKSFGSGFGVWLGPRGGYNYNGAMGKIIEKAGYGAYNAVTDDIDVGDRRYVSKLTEFFTQMQDAYKVNYWKLDGFATQACKDSTHKHMTGGKNGMYYFTDTWEAWIDLFEALRANAEKNGIDNLWFNLTCYVNPSPWYLQWANSIWIQNSQDMGRISVGQTSQVDQLLSYRDGRYFDFVKTRQFQFPLSNVYNHDPIYGKTGTNLANQMTDDDFKTYLYMMGTRGTSFWELYYSPEMIDEGQKWEINAEYLEWAKKNYHILRNAKLLGSTPDGGNTYGYSCWDGNEGIISMRNPSASEKTLTFTLDRNIGVSEDLKDKTLNRTTILNHKTTDAQTEYQTVKYGDVITITLQPGEARIWSLSTEKDTTAPDLTLVKATANNTIELIFDERVTGTPTATVNGTDATAEVSASQRKVTLTTAAPLTAGSKASVSVTGLTDLNKNAATVNTEVTYQEDQIVAKAAAKDDLKAADDVTVTTDAALAGKNALALTKEYELNNGTSVTGTADFAVASYVKTTGNSINILKQGSEYSLSVNADGKAVFTVGDVTVTSKETVNDGTWKHIAGIREKNGMVKIYVNGTLDSSEYGKDIKNLAEGTLTIGGGSDLQVSEAQVKDATMSLTTLEAVKTVIGDDNSGSSGIVPDANGKIPLQASNITVKRADTNADVANAKSPTSKMIDGDKSSGSFTCTLDSIESDVLNGTSVYFQIDLGDVFKLDQINMWRYFTDGRTYQDTMIVASKDANFDANDTVLYSTVSDESHAYGLLSAEKLADPDDTYAETSAGKTFAANETEARYIRIYMRGSVKTDGAKHGGNHICEVEVYGKALQSETAQKKHKITFDTMGGNSIDALKVADGATWSLPEPPTREGYVFKGWFTNVNCTADSAYTETAPITQDLTLFAKWEKQAVAVTGVTLNKTEATLTAKGQTVQLTAMVAPANATNKNVTYATSNAAVATVSESGLVTAVAKGTADITVTTEDGNKTAVCKVTVSIADQPTTVAVTGVTLNKKEETLTAKGQTVQLTATVAPANATNKNVTYATSNEKVATVSPEGLVTAVAKGTADITVTTADGNKTAVCKVTVNIADQPTTVAVTGVTLNKTEATLTAKGQTVQLTATVAPANATNKNVTYTTSNAAVATVSESGLVTAVAKGTADITVTTEDGNKTAVCKVTVSIADQPTTVAVTGVTLNKKEETLTAKGQTVQLTATVAPANATNKNVTYTTSDETVATVSESGLVTAVAKGTADITVTTEDGNKTAVCKVTVSIDDSKADEPTEVLNQVKAAIKDAESKKQSDYTTETWDAYQKALTAAKKAAEKTGATKAELEKALNDLKDAETKLEKVSGGQTQQPETPATEAPTAKVPAVGTTKTVGKAIYKVTKSDAKNGTVTLVKLTNKNEKKFTVPASVKVDGVSFKVTEISKNAFKNNKKLKQVTIGKNVTKIGANAFNGDSKLKKITIKSTKLKKVGKKAFKGINAKCRIKVPKKKLTAYKRLLKGKGQKAGVKITK